jgi:predicted MFS family arabinose efflux permease
MAETLNATERAGTTAVAESPTFKLDPRHVATYLLLGLGFAVVMGFMYMQYVYYDAMIATLGISNTQLGFLVSLVGITGVITSVPCGVFVDRVDCRKSLTFSLMGMMAFCALFALIPTYQIAIVTWTCAGIVMSFWYSAIYKTVRVIAPPNAIGKSFGMFGVGVAIGSIIVNVAGLSLYDWFANAYSLSVGLSAILWAFFIAGMISAIGGGLLVMSFEPQQPVRAPKAEQHKVRAVFQNLGKAVRDPGTWLYIGGCFCIYSFQVSLSYFTPYFTAVLGTTVAFSGIVAVFRQYGLRIISAPLGGAIGDKIGSTARIIRVSMVLLACAVVVVMLLPESTPLWVLVGIVFFLGLLGTMNISLQASISEDAMVPPQNMALVIGLTSIFNADLFQATMFGSWLDAFGNAGYTFIWLYTLGILVAGVVVLTVMVRRRERVEGRSKSAAPIAATAEGGSLA